MFEVVYNDCYGGFSLSNKALNWLKENGMDLGDNCYPLDSELPRHHPLLVKCVKELGQEAGNQYSNLVIAEVSSKSGKYLIREYDGLEWVETPDSINWVDAAVL
jgi:hypothetical protein